MKTHNLFLVFFCFAKIAFTQGIYRIELVKDIDSGAASSMPQNLTVLNNKIVFAATTAQDGTELWITDGTALGTHLLADINNSGSGLGQGLFHTFTPFGSHNMVFSADDGVHGDEPWITDGTPPGTHLIYDIRTVNLGSNYGSNAQYYTEYKNKMYFSAGTWIGGEQVYVTDGTVNGTSMLTNIGTGDAYPHDFLAYNGKLFFSAIQNSDGELWSTDGTASGTQLVKDINTTTFGGSDPIALTAFMGRFYFSATGDGVGRELYVSDGTAQGTQLFWDINKTSGGGSQPNQFAVHNNLMVFSASDDIHGTELWCTNADTAYLVRDINPTGNGLSCPAKFHNYNNKFYFSANENGECELWVTDCTYNGTYKILSRDSQRVESPEGFVNWNGKLVFVAGKYNNQLWISDGTSAGTYPVLPDSLSHWDALGAGARPFLFNNEIYFAAEYADTLGIELYKMYLDTVSGIGNPNEGKLTANVYPNPFSQSFTVTIPDAKNAPVTIILRDVTGRILMSEIQTEPAKSYNTMQLQSGLYFLLTGREDFFTGRKIIKQ